MTVTQPLREEHKELLFSIKEIGNLAESADVLSRADLQEKVKITLDFLNEELIPHALAEDEVLYPEIDSLSHFTRSTETMKYDHKEIARLTEDLSKSLNDKSRMRKLLYQLSLLVMLHFKKEEEIYLPFLDENLSKKDAQDLFEKMETAAVRIKADRN